MKVRAQIAMVLNLDKCIGCHTCSVTCKQVWTSRDGVEYAWFNNVETKPGVGYPKEWENQKRWKGGWRRKENGRIVPRIGGKWRVLANIFANPNLACVAACPSGSIYKREEDGIVLIDQDKCRGWRMCVSACPYKKIYYNWQSGKAEKCIFCYPRIEAGQPTVCSETCVGRIRYLGVLLYDADRIQEAASVRHDRDLYRAQLDIFLDPFDPQVIAQARVDGVPDNWMEAARNSPVYKMALQWKVALPLHPEYRTLPMVWYVPPLSPISAAANAGHVGSNGEIPDVNQLRIPVKYLANLLTAGDTVPVVRALERMLAMRAYQRELHVDGCENTNVLRQVGLTVAEVQQMYRVMAIANYEDRFVIPSSHREYAENAFDMKG